MRIHPLFGALATIAALTGATAALAQNTTAPAAPMTGTATKTVTTTHVEKKPLAATKVTRISHRTTTTATGVPGGRMVTAKTTTGKTITYNCSKAGNKNKKACQG